MDTEIQHRIDRLQDEAERARLAARAGQPAGQHAIRRALGRALVGAGRALEGLGPERPCLPEEA